MVSPCRLSRKWAERRESVSILAFGDDLRAFADHDHEEGNQRRGDEQDDAREQVNGEDEDQNADRDQRGDDQLREILAVIRIQRFDAFDCGGGQFAGALSARVGGTEIQDVVEESVAQVGFDLYGDGIGADFVDPGQKGTPGDDDEDEVAASGKLARESVPRGRLR